MAQRTYAYPFGNWVGRAILWLILSGVVFALLFDVPGALYDLVVGTVTSADFWRLGAALVLGLLFFIYATNLYPSVQEQDDGIRVAFFWWNLFVPWKNIIQVKEGGNLGFKNWTVQVRGLTPLHRLYGLLYLHAFKPAFLIFSTLPNHDQLLRSIHRRMPAVMD